MYNLLCIVALMMGMPSSENHYGEAVSAEKAPEAISTAVASLPPEQMYELMKQMKSCIQVILTELLYFKIKTITMYIFCRIIQLKLETCYYRILNLDMHYCKLKL